MCLFTTICLYHSLIMTTNYFNTCYVAFPKKRYGHISAKHMTFIVRRLINHVSQHMYTSISTLNTHFLFCALTTNVQHVSYVYNPYTIYFSKRLSKIILTLQSPRRYNKGIQKTKYICKRKMYDFF